MPVVGETVRSSGSEWAMHGDHSGAVAFWKGSAPDAPVDADPDFNSELRRTVQIDGKNETEGRVRRREVPPVVKGVDGFMDYDGGIATDRRDGSYLRYSSDGSAGYRWTERLGTVAGVRTQTNGYADNGDGVVDLPDSNELLALQNSLVTERVARAGEWSA